MSRRQKRFDNTPSRKADGQWKLFCQVHNIEELAHHGHGQQEAIRQAIDDVHRAAREKSALAGRRVKDFRRGNENGAGKSAPFFAPPGA